MQLLTDWGRRPLVLEFPSHPLENDDPNATPDQIVTSVVFGSISYNDPDSSDLHVVQSVTTGNGAAPDGTFVGDFDVDVANQFEDEIEWTLNVKDSEIEHLGEGETALQNYTIIINDNEGGTDITTVTVTLEGRNDRPDLVSGDDATLIEGDDALSASGTIAVTDKDIHDVVSSSSALNSVNGAQGGLELSTTELDALFAVSGGITGGTPNSNIDDPSTEALEGPNSGFADQATSTNGEIDWTFDAAAGAFDYLADGESIVLTYDITVTDDSGTPSASDVEQVVITILGTNDQPSITVADPADVTATLEEDGGLEQDSGSGATQFPISANGVFSVEDVDFTDTVTATVTSVVSSDNDSGCTATPEQCEALLGLLGLVTDGGSPAEPASQRAGIQRSHHRSVTTRPTTDVNWQLRGGR